MSRALSALALALPLGRAVAFAVAFVLPATANDYGALFRDHAAQVQQPTPDTRVLELPGPVVVTEHRRNGTQTYTAADQTGLGAVACYYHVLVDAVVAAGLCDTLLTGEEQHLLDQRLLRVSGFIADNSYPPMPEQAMFDRLLQDIENKRQAWKTCPLSGTSGQDAMRIEFMRNLSRPAVGAALERALSKPRLPVMNPCL
ncbi:MAG: hypothetical protein CSA70_07970 [Rhodobacterales bacterium]|nr:MAG: hypothetical protein CSA70_07970 [Rhodobacterales bacterium]